MGQVAIPLRRVFHSVVMVAVAVARTMELHEQVTEGMVLYTEPEAAAVKRERNTRLIAERVVMERMASLWSTRGDYCA